MADVMKLMAKLGLDARSYRKGLENAEQHANQFGQRVARRLAAAFSIGALTVAAKRTVEWAAKMRALGEQTGTTAKFMSQMEFAAEQTGSRVEDVAAALRQLSKSRNEALRDPKGQKAKLFKALGITDEELRSIRDIEQLLMAVGDAFKAHNFGVDELGMAQDLLSETGIKLLPAFRVGLRQLSDEADNLGVSIEDSVANRLESVKSSIDAIIGSLRGDFATALAAIADRFEEILFNVKATAAVIIAHGKFLAAKAAFTDRELQRGSDAVNPQTPFGDRAGPNLGRYLQRIFGGMFYAAYRQNAPDAPNLEKFMDEAAETIAAVLDERRDREDARRISDEERRRQGRVDPTSIIAAAATAKAVGLRPSTDALARIGGFVGRSNLSADNRERDKVRYARETAENTRQLRQNLRF